MEDIVESLTREELVMIRLSRLFARFGYHRYRMGKFETYDMYLANKAFLNNQQIITFTDGTGKLVALKPDVTMSIVKNLPADVKTRKLYYNENVFRMQMHGGEYQEIAQMGVEYVGAESAYAQAEILMLAAESLNIISPYYILNVNHMGFLSGIFDNMELPQGGRGKILSALRSKNPHSLNTALEELQIPEQYNEPLHKMVSLGGSFEETLQEAKAFCVTPQMETAWRELSAVYDALEGTRVQKHLGLDFSLIHDDDYYSGINMKGFIPGLPRAVLSGGRYDKLIRRFGKPQCAMGFAMMLGELTRMLAEHAEFDVDALLLFMEKQSPRLVMAAVKKLSQQGSVRAAQEIPEGYCPRKIYKLLNDGSAEEVSTC